MVFKLAASTGSYKKLDDMLYDIDDMLYDTEADESYEDEEYALFKSIKIHSNFYF